MRRCTTLTRRALLLGAPAAGLTACGPAGPIVLPDLALPGLPDLRTGLGWPLPGISRQTFVGRVTLLNVWASWCPYCRGEHALLAALSADPRFALAGIVWKDEAAMAVDYLRKAGNPFDAAGLDASGAWASALRQRGVPNSYVVDRTGAVTASHRGALSRQTFDAELLPAILAAL